MAPFYPAPRRRPLYRRILSFQNIVGFIVGFTVAAAIANWSVKAPLDYTVFVSEDGFGQPRLLFDLAERADPNLKLDFAPAQLRSVYVCESKRVSGESYTALVVRYLDAYRDCFAVTAEAGEELKIFPNTKSASLQQKEGGAFFCRCNGLPD